MIAKKAAYPPTEYLIPDQKNQAKVIDKIKSEIVLESVIEKEGELHCLQFI